MYGIADLDNCYCSCEKVFRPDLEGKPIVVLSNNDGCVVARSNEAKKMGIKEGTPYFQLAQQFPGQKIAVFSSIPRHCARQHLPSAVSVFHSHLSAQLHNFSRVNTILKAIMRLFIYFFHYHASYFKIIVYICSVLNNCW